MKQVLVESKKTYHHGFVLREPELRRLIDVITDQFRKLGGGEVNFLYIIKYQNGTVAETSDLDVVFAQENLGSASIVKLVVLGNYTLAESESSVEVTFKNVASQQEEGEIAIRFVIKSDSRDWVFITSSIIDERISKIKRFNYEAIFENRGGYRSLFQILFFAVLWCVMMYITFSSSNAEGVIADRLKKINEIESNWSKKLVKDEVQVIINIARAQAVGDLEKERQMHSISSFPKIAIWIGCGIVFMFVLVWFTGRFYPAYNFCWGDYLESFNKKEAVIKFVLIGVVLALVLSVIGGLITNYLSKV